MSVGGALGVFSVWWVHRALVGFVNCVTEKLVREEEEGKAQRGSVCFSKSS